MNSTGTSAEITVSQRSSAGGPRRPHGQALVTLAPEPADALPNATVHRALLAYLGEVLAVPGADTTTVAYSIAFLAPVELTAGLALARSSNDAPPADGYAHTLAQFVAPGGEAVARVSHAARIHHSGDRLTQLPQAFR